MFSWNRDREERSGAAIQVDALSLAMTIPVRPK
jgi:hypothetical protein